MMARNAHPGMTGIYISYDKQGKADLHVSCCSDQFAPTHMGTAYLHSASAISLCWTS